MSENRIPNGIHTLAFERYKAAFGVSKTMLDILDEKTPAHLIEYLNGEPEPETPAQRFGTITHRALLEPDTYSDGFYIKPKDMTFTTKEGKAWRDEHKDRPILCTDEANTISCMVSAVHTHPFAKRLLAGAQTEQCVFVEDGSGTLRKSRLDALTKGNVIPDVKTTESAALGNFERSVSKYRYHVQAAYYLDNCQLAGLDKQTWFFICVEKSAPFAVRCLQLDPLAIEYGRKLYQRDLQIYRNCLESGEWPAWESGYTEVGLPSWELRQLEAAA